MRMNSQHWLPKFFLYLHDRIYIMSARYDPQNISVSPGYPLTLDFFHFVNRHRGEALDSTCMFGAMFQRILVRVKTFFRAN